MISRNLITNPKGGAGTVTGWSIQNGAGANIYNTPPDQPWAPGFSTGFVADPSINTDVRFHYTAGISVVPGDVVRFAGWVGLLGAAFAGQASLDIARPGFVDIAESAVVPAQVGGGWFWVNVTYVAVATETLQIYVRNTTMADIQFTGMILTKNDGTPLTDPGTYFDGDTAGFKWDGTANASTSSGDRQQHSVTDPPVLRDDLVNLCSNGNFERDTVGAAPAEWVSVGQNATVQSGTFVGSLGTKFVRCAGGGATWAFTQLTPSPVVPGVNYTASARLGAISDGRTRINIRWYDANNIFLSAVNSATFGGGGTPKTVSVAGNAPAKAAFGLVQFEQTSGGAFEQIDLDTIMFAPTKQGATYLDGDIKPLIWTGSPGASYSSERVIPIGDELYEELAPLVDVWGDPSEHLKVYVNGLAAMIQPVDDIAKDGPNGEPGWSQVLDINRAEDAWLMWLGQWAGYIVPAQAATETEAAWSARERGKIVHAAAHHRATVTHLVEAIQDHLNDPKQVIIQERAGDAHTINVYIFNSQIATSAARVEAAARAQKAAGLIMNFTVLTGANYTLLQASNTSYTIMSGKHANYNSVLTNPGL